MNKKSFSYKSCEKCGNAKAETYQVMLSGKMIAGGMAVRLCPRCVRELRTDLYKFAKEWLSKK